jgi:hypothetical protein
MPATLPASLKKTMGSARKHIVIDIKLNNRSQFHSKTSEAQPVRVDLLDWNAITPEFQKIIASGYEIIKRANR